MKESDLYQPARAWIEKNYPCHVIHVEKFDADIIVVNTESEHVVVVELKKSLSYKLYLQCQNRIQWANAVWAFVPTKNPDPGMVRMFKARGFGILQLVGDNIKVRCKAKPQPWSWHKARIHRLKRLKREHPAMPHELAGVPSKGRQNLPVDKYCHKK